LKPLETLLAVLFAHHKVAVVIAIGLGEYLALLILMGFQKKKSTKSYLVATPMLFVNFLASFLALVVFMTVRSNIIQAY
jgi:hypothetical protein